MTPSEYVARVLGGAKVFRPRRSPDPSQLRRRIRAGLPYAALDELRQRLRLSLPETARVLDVPLRTLARRRRAGRLDPVESDRLYRLACIGAQAVALLGDEQRAAVWLRRPNRALGGEPPLDLLDTEPGTRQVEDVLGRLAHGLVS